MVDNSQMPFKQMYIDLDVIGIGPNGSNWQYVRTGLGKDLVPAITLTHDPFHWRVDSSPASVFYSIA